LTSQLSYQERIRQERQGFSKGFRRLADFLLDSPIEASFMTANELAQALDLDPATVVRFAQHLGYAGFPELQQEIRRQVKQQLRVPDPDSSTTDVFDTACQALQSTRQALPIERVTEFVDALSAADRVLLVADPPATWLAENLSDAITAVGIKTEFIALDSRQLAQVIYYAGQADMLLAIDILGQTSVLERALHLARERGLPVALITGAASFHTTDHAGIILAAHRSDDPLTGLVCSISIVQAVLQTLHEKYADRITAVQSEIAKLARQIRTGN